MQAVPVIASALRLVPTMPVVQLLHELDTHDVQDQASE